MRLLTAKETGRLVRAKRRELNMTQQDLANSLRRAQSHISYLERGLREIPREELDALSRLLEIPLEALVLGASEIATRDRLPTSEISIRDN
jgi:transcriptional regulator with XRE-family HTH domain